MGVVEQVVILSEAKDLVSQARDSFRVRFATSCLRASATSCPFVVHIDAITPAR